MKVWYINLMSDEEQDGSIFKKPGYVPNRRIK